MSGSSRPRPTRHELGAGHNGDVEAHTKFPELSIPSVSGARGGAAAGEGGGAGEAGDGALAVA